MSNHTVLCYNHDMIAAHTTYQLRVYPPKAGHRRLDTVLADSARLYNAALQERRDAYGSAAYHVPLNDDKSPKVNKHGEVIINRRQMKKPGSVSITLYDQMRQFTGVRADLAEWGNLDVNVGRGVLKRLDRTMNAFFRRVKAGETPGFPRFQSGRRWRTIDMAMCRPNMVKAREEGRKAHIRIKGLPALELRLKRPLPDSENLVNLRLVKRPNGWYADLTYRVNKEPLPPNGMSVGLDMGVNHRIALSTGQFIGINKPGPSRSRRGWSVAPRPNGREHRDGSEIPVIPLEGMSPGDADAPNTRHRIAQVQPMSPGDADAPHRLTQSDHHPAMSPGDADAPVDPVAVLQRRISRCKRGSRNQRKLYRQLARLRRRQAVRNRNECHRITTGIIRQFDRIAVEKLTITNMTRSASGTVEEPGKNVAAKSGLNREILAQTWGLIRNQLAYKAEWAGREFVEVNPRYTSRECWACGHQTPQSEYRTYRCGVCGTSFDRDTNAAINVCQRAFGPLSGAGISPRLL